MHARKLITVGLMTLLLPGPVFAQAPSNIARLPSNIQLKLDTRLLREINLTQMPAPKREASLGKKVAWGLLGGFGGFFAGGFIGSKIERSVHDCNCDDPGLQGFLIGLPVGAALGAIAGVKLASR